MNQVDSFWVRALMAMATLSVGVTLARAQERTHTAEQMEQLAKTGELDGTAEVQRPAKLPDLTKGQPIGEKSPTNTWHLGPTGIMGHMVGGFIGDQIVVESVLKGSPAEGKVLWGDVILGVNGQTFKTGEHMGMVLGNAIIESEKEQNKGVLTLKVWRDANFIKRNGSKDIAGTDVDDLFNTATDDDTLYKWMPKSDQEKATQSSNFKDFPLAGDVLDVVLTLPVLPSYSDTSPYDCPKAARILENALKLVARQFEPEKNGRTGRGGSVEALALVASGKPEYVALVKQWLRSPGCKTWQPPTEEDDPLRLPGKSWNMSFEGLDCALYYDATRDDFVLPALTRYAIRTARGQDAGGTWGHNWAQPFFNGGQLHGMNPGYGALNASGNRCFFLLALAQKLGVKHPELDAAVRRSRRFFESYVDKGAIPYGQHPAASTDDSNGKNSGVAYALLMLGDKYGAKYFAQMSTHASFTRRGGHGNDYFWHWSPWAASICGPRGVIAAQRNLRWRFTLCRRFDGGFVIHSPTKGIQSLRDPTATYALHYAVPLKQTLITGKDADESLWWTDHEYERLLTLAQPQLSDPVLLAQAGPPLNQRSTKELVDHLNVFKPNTRDAIAKNLAARYAAGEKEVLPRLTELLSSDDARFRQGAILALTYCGPEATLQYMSGVAKLLHDPHEFVRIQAAQAMAKASNSPEIQAALLKAVVEDPNANDMSPNNFSHALQGLLFGGNTELATKPFDAGLDQDLVYQALERILTLDPAGGGGLMSSRQKVWTGNTVVRLSGPLVYTAEEEQIADQMFSGRRSWSLDFLNHLGYQEGIEACASYLRKWKDIPRTIRGQVYFKRGNVKPQPMMKNPGAALEFLPLLKEWLTENPLAVAHESKDEPSIALYQLIAAIEAAQPRTLPRLSTEVERFFQQQLDEAQGSDAKLALCREILADPLRRDYFRMNAAMTYLAKTLDAAAVEDLLPYVGHDYWRLRRGALRLLAAMESPDTDAKLAAAFAQAHASTASAILETLAQRKSPLGRNLATEALSHASPAVRAQAAQTLFALAGAEALPAIFDLLKKASHHEEFSGCEAALLSQPSDDALAQRIRDQALALLPQGSPPLRDTLYWLLAQVGGKQSMDVLRGALATKDEREYRSILNALSYSPDPEAEMVILDTIAADPKSGRADIAAREGVRRMVIGPQGVGTRPVSSQLDYAQAVLSQTLNSQTIAYLGRIHTGRCAHILQQAMRRGAPQSAAQVIVVATADLSNADERDRKLAESALIDTIEFIEVTYLRGGATEQLERNPEAWRTYAQWQAISAQAGKNLLKLTGQHKPKLPEFNDADLGL